MSGTTWPSAVVAVAVTQSAMSRLAIWTCRDVRLLAVCCMIGDVAVGVVLHLAELQERGLADLLHGFFGRDARDLDGEAVALALDLGLGDTELR